MVVFQVPIQSPTIASKMSESESSTLESSCSSDEYEDADGVEEQVGKMVAINMTTQNSRGM